MATYTGVNGQVRIGSSTLAEITQWELTREANVADWNSSSSAGYRKRATGSKTASGSFDYVTDSADPMEGTLVEGDSVTLLLDEEASGRTWTVPAIITSVSTTTDIDGDEMVGGTVEFESNGAWTAPS